MIALNRFQKQLAWLIFLPIFMLAASFAAVPFYSWFCKVTGFSGTTQEASVAPDVILDQQMEIYFSASIAKDMPWEFRPMTPKMDVRIGEVNLVMFEAYNPTNETIYGTATFNVAPFELGQYFSKIECFCFTEQKLEAGERIEMPVTFYVDPAMVEDEDTKSIEALTLAYTFHRIENDES